jgi:RNA polymerase sigma-70 factor (ECF subfamily)
MSMRSTTFHELYSQHAKDVYRFALFLTGNAADAADITAETFVRVWTAAESPQLASVKAYLFAIARNLHRKQWRRARRWTELDHEICDAAPTPDATVEQQDEFRHTFAALQQLSELDRTLLLMRADGELTYQDIAAATGLSIPTAKVKVFRARERLSALLHTDRGTDP